MLQLVLNYIAQNIYEVLGFITSLICVYYNARQKIVGWYWAIISGILSAKLFYDIKLFGDMYLQFFFIITAFYGIYEWKYCINDQKEYPIRKANLKIWCIIVIFFVIAYPLIILLLAHQKSDLIYIDGFTSCLSVLAQILMTRKYLENWLIWIFVNILYVGLYAYKGVWLYSILYLIFIFLAYYGLQSWKKTLKK